MVHIGARGDMVLIGTDGDIAIGAATDILTRGSMIHGMEDGTTLGITAVSMTHGTMVDIMEDITAGMALTTVTISTAAGMTHFITITDTVLAT